MSRTELVAALVVSVIAAAPVVAQDAMVRPVGKPEPIVISITKTDCSRLIQHVPAADVAYQPGVDVRGRAVASADVDPAREAFAKSVVPDVLEIPLTINPVGYAQRNAAYAQKSKAASAVTSNSSAITTAKANATTLSSQLSSLQSQLSSVRSTYNSKTAANVSSTGGSSPTSQQTNIRNIRQKEIDSVYNPQITSLNSQITSVNSSITANNTNLTSLQSKDTTLRQTYTDTDISTQATLAGQSSRGLDSTQMKVGTVKYDMAKNSFTFNGEPMVSDDQARLAEACARKGVR